MLNVVNAPVEKLTDACECDKISHQTITVLSSQDICAVIW